ncbi:MAG: hypothetical protein AB1333_03905 [Patescibacteria group bacterium]
MKQVFLFKKRDKRNQSGQLLLELLVAVAAAAIIVTLGAQTTYVSIRGNKVAGDKNIALGLAQETLTAVDGVATEKWQNVYDLTKGSAQYYTATSSGKWVIASGTQDYILNNVIYTRSFTIQNVCRSTSTRAITGITDTSGGATTCSTNTGSHDPSTQKINITISWPEADPLTESAYITRWRNKVFTQTQWSTMSEGPATSSASLFYSTTTNVTGTSSLQICSGGC